MRNGILFSLFLCISSTTATMAQFTFGVAPGLALNGTYVGYKLNNKFMPYLGLQYISAGFGFEERGRQVNDAGNQLVDYTFSNSLNAHLLIPSLGLKYFLTQQNKLQTYVSANLSRPLLFGKAELDGVSDETFTESLKNLSLFGGELGFGVEYFFDENFSIGGEFGLRTMRLRYQNNFERTVFNPATSELESVPIEQDYRFALSPTYSRISLNFYF